MLRWVQARARGNEEWPVLFHRGHIETVSLEAAVNAGVTPLKTKLADPAMLSLPALADTFEKSRRLLCAIKPPSISMDAGIPASPSAVGGRVIGETARLKAMGPFSQSEPSCGLATPANSERTAPAKHARRLDRDVVEAGAELEADKKLMKVGDRLQAET